MKTLLDTKTGGVGWLWECFGPPGGLLCRPFWGGGPGVGLTLCCFVVYSAGRFVVCLSVCHLFLCFSVLLVLRLPRLGEAGVGGWSWCFLSICSVCACLDLSVSSSS